MAIGARRIGSIRNIDLIPFNKEGGFVYIVFYATINLLIFLPLGVLLPELFKKMRKSKKYSLGRLRGKFVYWDSSIYVGMWRFPDRRYYNEHIGLFLLDTSYGMRLIKREYTNKIKAKFCFKKRTFKALGI